MNIVIIGGAGVIGRKVAQALIARGHIDGHDIRSLVLADVATPVAMSGCRSIQVDISDPTSVADALPEGTDLIYHLAAVVSSHAEADFDAGMAVNLTGTLNVLQRARELGTCPRVVYASSAAVYGGDAPDPTHDLTYLNPQTSYGTQKVIGELLLNDYSRRGFVDGRGFRLPTISVRPGLPNRAASSFMSSILREPLNGKEAICPVDVGFLHYYLSPRLCAQNLVMAAEINAHDLGMDRNMIMPGKMWSIQQLIDAMTAVAGPEPAKLIRFEPQPEVEQIVRGWRYDFTSTKGLALGLMTDSSFQDNIRYYLEDDQP
ncbi:MAG: NAD-dependent epimerase/dehydratase family protein [Pseudoprimorskyibacter sp.]|nr:NAD-dependent epimerase/dehydratase family protein [Pseudoprimorskyibacter sp.]